MFRSTAILAALAFVGCDLSTAPQNSPSAPLANDQSPESESLSTFDGSDLPHAAHAIALVRHLSKEQYRLAKYLDEPGVPFASEHVAAFLRTGSLPDGKELMGPDGFSWRIDARVPRADPAVPDTPWYYDQSHLRGTWAKPFSSELLPETKREWQKTSVAFGPEFHDAGRKLLNITAVVLASPAKFKTTPYIDIRTDESANFAEFLAFADGYWLHVFVTEWRAPEPESIVTLSFTAHCPDRHAPPPDDHSNLLLLESFK